VASVGEPFETLLDLLALHPPTDEFGEPRRGGEGLLSELDELGSAEGVLRVRPVTGQGEGPGEQSAVFGEAVPLGEMPGKLPLLVRIQEFVGS